MDVANRYVFVEIQNRCIYIITSHHLRVQYIYIYIYISCLYIYIIMYNNLCVNYITYIYIHVQIDHTIRTCLRHTHTHCCSRRGLRLPRGEAGGGVCLPQRRLVDVQMSRSRNLVKSMVSGRCNVIIPTYVYIYMYVCIYICICIYIYICIYVYS